MVLNVAYRMDTAGNKVEANKIAMPKLFTPKNCVKVVDWAMQVFGAMGPLKPLRQRVTSSPAARCQGRS